MDVSALRKRYEQALKLRQPWESAYQECYDYALPGRQSFFSREPTQDAPEIFDPTAVIGTQEFASRMQAGMVPNFSRWIKLEAGEEVPETARKKINAELEKTTRVFFEYLNASNFSEQVHEALIDISLGTASLECVEGSSIEPLVFSATPLPELAIEPGPNNEMGGFFRGRKMRCSKIESAYGVTISSELRKKLGGDGEDPEVTVVSFVVRDYEKENEFAYDCYVFLDHDDGTILKSQSVNGRGSNQHIGFRWSKVAGEVWGRGPLFNMMPTIRVLNLVTQLTLENAELAVAGLYTYEDDGVLNPDNVLLRPGTMMPIAPGSSGVRQFNTAGNFEIGDLVVSRLQQQVQKGLYNETLGPTDKTPMSATEVSQRMADLSRQIGSAFGRLQVELVNAIVDRVLYLLDKAGKLQRPKINGRDVKIVATSPLAQAQAIESVNAVTNHLGIVQQFYGDRGIELYTDGAQVAQYVQEQLGIPERINRDEDNRQDLVENVATAQAAGLGGSNGATGIGP